MRKISFFAVSVLGFFLPLLPLQAQEMIKAFDVQATLSVDRKLEVTESITYDFAVTDRHGIYRLIPEVYDRDGAKYRLHLDVKEVLMDDASVPWETSKEGSDLSIKIGDPDKTIRGAHVYRIIYTTKRAINDFSDHQELYWNVTGNGWPVAINEASFEFVGPAQPNRLDCFTGQLGSTDAGCDMTVTASGMTAYTSRGLAAGEGLTVVISFPLGTVKPLSFWDKAVGFLMDNSWAILPFVVFAIMFSVWRKHGKEPRGRGVVVAHYEEPKKLTPALMTALTEQKVSQKAITASILDLARRGYLKIKFEGEPDGGWLKPKQKFTLVKGDTPGQEARTYETTLWQGLFESGDETKLEDLKGKFWKQIEQARKEVFEELATQKLFGKNPSVVRASWIVGAVVLVVLSQFLIPFFGPAFLVSAALSGLIIVLFGWQMPRMTKLGAEVVEEVEGFKKFLSVTEKDRLDFTDAPERTPTQFERFLPAAVAFGVEQKWAEQFKGIDLPQPSYVQGSVAHWNAVNFASAMSNFHDASASSMYRPPASTAGGGGSGFSGGGSGGGFGGGGGGSW